MALGDIWHLRGSVTIEAADVKAGAAASIKAGEPVIKDGSNAGYVKSPGATVNTDVIVHGIAVSTSTDTASADGKVFVMRPLLGSVFRAKAKTTLSQAQKRTNCVIDLTSSVYTVDNATTTKGLAHIEDYDSVANTVEFTFKASALENA